MVDRAQTDSPVLAAEHHELAQINESFDLGPDDLTGNGGYLQANYRLNRRWLAGIRGDYLNNYGAGGELYQVVPSITWWQSEWVFFRLQYNYVKPRDGGGSHTVLLQTVWAVGPHKHETY